MRYPCLSVRLHSQVSIKSWGLTTFIFLQSRFTNLEKWWPKTVERCRAGGKLSSSRRKWSPSSAEGMPICLTTVRTCTFNYLSVYITWQIYDIFFIDTYIYKNSSCIFIHNDTRQTLPCPRLARSKKNDSFWVSWTHIWGDLTPRIAEWRHKEYHYCRFHHFALCQQRVEWAWLVSGSLQKGKPVCLALKKEKAEKRIRDKKETKC